MSATDSTVALLLDEADLAVRAMTHRDPLGHPVPPDAALKSPVVRALLTDPLPTHPYAKWSGAHWRLVSLVELGIPTGQPDAVMVCDRVLTYWADRERLAQVRRIAGRVRRCASQEGNAVAVASRLGLARDPRVEVLVEHLLDWQWPDGGWNCDKRAEAAHSSFHETLPALWGLHEFVAARGESVCDTAIGRAGELLLEHQVIYSRRTGKAIHPTFVRPHYPPYWHYDLLQALLVLDRAGFGADPRTARARQALRAQRRRDGTWRAVRPWWRPPGATRGQVEAVDWGKVAHQMVTLNALRVGAGSEPPVDETGDVCSLPVQPTDRR